MNPDRLAETAIRQILIDGGITIPILKSFQDDTERIVLPSVSIKSLGGLTDPATSACERLTFVIELYSSAIKHTDDNPTPAETHLTNWDSVCEILLDDNVDELLSAAVADFTAFDSVVLSRGPNNTLDNRFISQMSMVLSASAADV